LHFAGFEVWTDAENAPEAAAAAVAQLVTELNCLAACKVECQALQLIWRDEEGPPADAAAQLAAALAQLAPTLTHMCLQWEKNTAQLCQTLPHLRSLVLGAGAKEPDVAQLLLYHPSLTQLQVYGVASSFKAAWVEHLLLACTVARASDRPQGPLTVQLPPLWTDLLAAAQQQWAQLTAQAAQAGYFQTYVSLAFRLKEKKPSQNARAAQCNCRPAEADREGRHPRINHLAERAPLAF
jgi:hypothetical protein